jgi:hypothetical protein
MTFKQAVVGLGLVFIIVLAIVVAKQMSAEAMAVVIGIVCGVAASIPTSLLLFVTLTQRERRKLEQAERQARRAQGQYPPVVVIQGGAQQALPQGSQAGYWPTPPPGPTVNRQFHVVGGDDLIVDGEGYWTD